MTGGGMTGDNSPPANENQANDPKRRIPRPDSNALIQGLEHLRECIERRLKGLEAATRRQPGATVREPAGVEGEFQQTIVEYEEAQLRLRLQAERRDQEWRAALEQLDGDRKLLADAWERLERERLEGFPRGPAQGADRLPRFEGATMAPIGSRPELADPGNDVLSHTILKQFQALRNDVRRNARQRGHR
jgi:hypothetical protein